MTSNREYSYYLPTFMLQSLKQNYLGSPLEEVLKRKDEERLQIELKQNQKEEEAKNEKPVEEESKEDKGIKIIRQEDEGYDSDLAAEAADYTEKPVDDTRLTKEILEKFYKNRISPEMHEQVQKKFLYFKGIKPYHNYTRDITAKMPQAKRNMLELRAHELVYFNIKTLEVSNKDDPDAIEFIHFWFKGQSFLYNQIRKMVGSIIQQFRGELEEEFQARTMQENKLEIALAPGDGLMLEQVCYDSFNKSAKKKEEIKLTLVTQKEEQQKFRESIISHMLKSEIEERKFSKWLITFDSFCEDYYVQLEKMFR